MITITNKLIEKILINTLQKGGYSIDLSNGEDSFNKGYFVAVDNTEVQTPLAKGTLTRTAIKNFIIENRLLLNVKGRVLGLWIESNKLYIDVSKKYNELEYAKKCGIRAKQLAIFCNETKEVIDL